MSETLSLSGIEYIPAKVAGKRFGYTSDYIAKLARDGVVVGSKVGHQWFVVEESVRNFIDNKSREKAERNDAIRVVRQQELAEYKKRFAAIRVPETKTVDVMAGRRVAVLETLVILIIGLSIGASGYVMTAPNTQTASIASASYSAVERLAIALYSFVTGGSKTEVVITHVEPAPSVPSKADGLVPLAIDSPNGKVVSSTGTTTHTSLVIAPGEVFTATTVEAVRESFSDEVSVSVDPLNPDTGIIVPHFRDRDGEEYRFLLVPVNANQNGG